MNQRLRYGLHRVVEPPGVLPQAAWKLDPQAPLTDGEILIEVETLNIDSASFKQIKDASANDPEQVQQKILDIIQKRGKMHNPVTGSGGMLIGKVAKWGKGAPVAGIQPGDRIASLVSLTLTPLRIESIQSIDTATGQVRCQGQAILFASGLWAPVPDDIPPTIALAALDVCGAPAQTAKYVGPGQTVVVLGAGGKSGLLSVAAAREKLGSTGRLIAIDYGEVSLERLQQLGDADVILKLDANRSVDVMEEIAEATGGRMADVTINCVNIPGTEMSAVLATRSKGLIYFFSMATSFTAAALGAEGVGQDVEMMIGNGYTEGHWQYTFQLIRGHDRLRGILAEMFGVKI